MKKDLHPELKLTEYACVCGEQFTALGIRDKISVEICSNCHPFYTGKKRVVDTAGRVERFKQRSDAAGGRGKKIK
ncbi:MAG: 50S ribosomal protein L31 [Planctomycetales bacterium]|nr:50S ribosomal protein L31 [bacterium]UNM08129.1 MAG: 50S ribosomal protein L31 [Planctomycetales bacterium]